MTPNQPRRQRAEDAESLGDDVHIDEAGIAHTGDRDDKGNWTCGSDFCVHCLAEANARRERTKPETTRQGQAKWARTVITRDGKCTSCGSTDDLTAHHIKPWSTHPELRYEPSNGATLCKPCHRREHPDLHAGLFQQPHRRERDQ